ncbi:MAG: site-2 protease family protein [Oscillospiraceae bacterium]|nr:site-2 protease family protein [Oscillospiraceae bacterium]
MSIVIAIIVFCVIILLHEFGHFIAAKACGIYVKEFALGMGPVILRKKGKETEYVIRALPIGGSCSFEGENGGYDEDDDPTVTLPYSRDEEERNPRAFNAKPVWQRMIVILAGPLMNLILGYIVVVISLITSPAMASTTIAEFKEQSVSGAYLMENDEILSVDGLPVFSVSDVSYKLQSSDRKNADGNLVFDFTVRRNGEKITVKDVEFMTMEREDGSTGVYFDFYVYRLEKNFKNVVIEGFRESCSTARLIIMTLIDMLRGKYGLNDLSGPIGVGTVITEAVKKYTFADVMSIVSLITINLGVFNLLPIPALDGARFIFLVVELIRRKPAKPEVEGMVHFVGFAMLMLLMVVVTFNDIIKLATGGFK